MHRQGQRWTCARQGAQGSCHRSLSFTVDFVLAYAVHMVWSMHDLIHRCAGGSQLVVVFMVGGTTYEEARAVADLNAQVLPLDCASAAWREACRLAGCSAPANAGRAQRRLGGRDALPAGRHGRAELACVPTGLAGGWR